MSQVSYSLDGPALSMTCERDFIIDNHECMRRQTFSRPCNVCTLNAMSERKRKSLVELPALYLPTIVPQWVRHRRKAHTEISACRSTRMTPEKIWGAYFSFAPFASVLLFALETQSIKGDRSKLGQTAASTLSCRTCVVTRLHREWEILMLAMRAS